nr:hypothetical protein [Tetrasphaera sp. HKS02]
MPGEVRHRPLVARGHVLGNHGDLVQRQSTLPQRRARRRQLSATPRHGQDVACVGRRQSGTDDEVVLRRSKPAIAPVTALEQLGADLDQLTVRAVEATRDLGALPSS